MTIARKGLHTGLHLFRHGGSPCSSVLVNTRKKECHDCQVTVDLQRKSSQGYGIAPAPAESRMPGLV